jgi:NAD-dependent deacetylase
MRPDVVFFNEQLSPEDWTFARQTVHQCDALLVAGTSCQVHPVATLPVLARPKRKLVLEINPNPTQTTSVADECLRMTAAVGLPWLVDTVLDRARPLSTS